jgi:hypothetical protein
MRICVVIPSPDYAMRAGARIRYRRLVEPLHRLGHDIVRKPLETFSGIDDITDDVYLLSKCHDAGSLILAHQARRRGRLVGIDLFDDYFSQIDDSRFAHLRRWLAQAVDAADFLLCSTPTMQAVARKFAARLPAHVLNDPCPPCAADDLGRRLASNRDRLRTSRRLTVAWFGMGDNPHFPAGLADLVAFGDLLARLRGRGFETRLKILTNRRALTPDTMEAVRNLPLPFEIAEWSEAAEASLLAESDVAFLPVNAQPFSVAKSLNRAVTALCAGAQVLSAGYPLYASLAPFIYRDPDELVADTVGGTARLRPDTASLCVRLVAERADPDGEAAECAAFLAGRVPAVPASPPGDAQASPRWGVVHGHESPPLAHKLARRLGALSIGTPFADDDRDYDVTVRLQPTMPHLQVLVKQGLADLIEPAVKRRMTEAGRTESGWLRWDCADVVSGADLSRVTLSAAHAAAAPLVLAGCAAAVRQIFGGLRLVLSDQASLGYPLPDGFAGSSWIRP